MEILSTYIIGHLIIEDFIYILLGVFAKAFIDYYKAHQKYKHNFLPKLFIQKNIKVWFLSLIGGFVAVLLFCEGYIYTMDLVLDEKVTWNSFLSSFVSYLGLDLLLIIDRNKSKFLDWIEDKTIGMFKKKIN